MILGLLLWTGLIAVLTSIFVVVAAFMRGVKEHERDTFNNWMDQ